VGLLFFVCCCGNILYILGSDRLFLLRVWVCLFEVRLDSDVSVLFVEVYRDGEDDGDLCVTATVGKDGGVCLDFGFFVDVFGDDLDFVVFDDGSWRVMYIDSSELGLRASWFPDVSSEGKCLWFHGLEFVKSV